MKPKAENEAKYLLYAWTQYETLFISFLFMHILFLVQFQSICKYIEWLQAWQMVKCAKSQILMLREYFSNLTTLLELFVKKFKQYPAGSFGHCCHQKAFTLDKIKRKKGKKNAQIIATG